MKTIASAMFAASTEGLTVYWSAQAFQDHKLGLLAVAATLLFLAARLVRSATS